MKKRMLIFVALAVLLVANGLSGMAQEAAPQPVQAGADKIDPEVLAQVEEGGETTFLVYLAEQANLSAAYDMRDWEARGWYVLDALREVAGRTQPAVLQSLAVLRAAGHVSEVHPHYIINLIVVRGDAAAARALARLPEVGAVYPEFKIELVEPVEVGLAGSGPETVEWNIAQIQADQVWSTYGIRGAGVVVANVDTGVEYDHPALVSQYRGNLGGGVFEHNYNWWDPLDLYDYPYPVHGSHGTHVMGTSVGYDGADNEIGVAPEAQWIAAAGCCPSTEALLSATEWMIAPWQVNDFDPSHPTADPTKRPHVVNNSWGGAGGRMTYNALLEAQRASGILPVMSAGNNGPQCGTLGSPGDNVPSFSVGATDSSDTIASFSSRGPDPFHSWFGLFGVSPDLSAPGVNIRSSVPGGGYAGGWSGTSMAAPHVAGTVALLLSAEPDLVGRLDEIEEILRRTSVPLTSSQQCGGVPGSEIPNNTFGWGRIDALAAVEMIWHAGTLAGTVAETGSGAPVEGARVLMERNGYTLSTTTDANGDYEFLLGEGSYDVTVEAYGYASQTAIGVGITQDTTTVRDFALVPLVTYTLSGVVEEGAVQAVGDPVWARVGVRYTPIDVSSDPASGAYSSPIAEGEYDMRVVARGYVAEDRSITVSGDLTEDFALEPVWTYYVRDSRSPCGPTFDWIDARDGTPHNVGDDAYFYLYLPDYPFTFYGNIYDIYYVGSNGFISFGQGYTRPHMIIPFEGAPNNAIYGFAEDLNPENGTQGIIYDKVVDDRYLVIEFYQVEHWASGNPETFEFILDLETGAITLQYLEVSLPDFAMVGIENEDGSDGIPYSYANSAGITDSLAVGFYPVFGALPADQDETGVTGTLSGTVYVSGTVTPVPDAQVTAASFLDTLVTTANGEGEYVFADVCADLYTLGAEATGYYPSELAEARLRWPGDVVVTDLYLEAMPTPPAPVVSKTVAMEHILPGELVTYTLSLANEGESDLVGAVLSDTLPGVVEYLTSTPPGFYEGGTVTWTVAISAGGSAEVTLVGRLDMEAVPSTTVTNTVFLLWEGESVWDEVAFHVHWPPALVLSKTVAMEHILPGELVTYTLSLANEGQSDLVGAVLSDTLPEVVEYLTSTPPGFYEGGTVTWTVEISAGGSAEVTLVGRLDVEAVPSTTVTNTVFLLWEGESVWDEAVFHVQWPPGPEYRIYLPIVMRSG